MAQIHKDVEFAVDDAGGQERVFKDPEAAKAFAVDMAIMSGHANLDVLIWSPEGAKAYGGDDAVEQYYEDEEASVFERFEIRVNAVGRVP